MTPTKEAIAAAARDAVDEIEDEREPFPAWGEKAKQKYTAIVLNHLTKHLPTAAADEPVTEDWALRELADGWITNNEREGPHGFYRNARRVLDAIANDERERVRQLIVGRLKDDAYELEQQGHGISAAAVTLEADEISTISLTEGES